MHRLALPAPLVADGSCANTGLAARAGNLALIDASVLCLINRQRSLRGLAPLRADLRLASAAQRHSDDMAAASFFDHRGSAGDTFGQRIDASGYLRGGRVVTLGENIAQEAAPRATAAAMVADWMASAEHRANILDTGFHDTGIGMATGRPSGGATITEDFGARS